ncbi:MULTISPECIES: hypothetical protein [Aeromonas]|uniref:hypothetical protein n=1 Tax=Aeromonas TaxID=642 RepID=UPI0012EB2864|nr:MULTISPECIES: hypothetical protein [Aeromonas]MCQ4052817.1 hypothetical protein [Aeromonas sp. SG16]
MTVDHIEKSEHLEALEVSLREEWHAMIASGAPKADIIAKSQNIPLRILLVRTQGASLSSLIEMGARCRTLH